MSVIVFDIETVPDVEAGRRVYELKAEEVSDAEVAEVMFRKASEQTGQAFIRLPFHRIVAISAVYKNNEQLKIFSLGDLASSEADIIQRFFDGIEKYTPQLISWNGGGFDLPVLHYRALYHGINAAKYWDTGEQDHQFKWNNYLSRYHQRHLDLMDVLAAYQPRACSRLNDVACLLGFPGKMGMDGSQVWSQYQEGHLQEIRDYCETDVLNTYLIYLKFQLMRGHLNIGSYQTEIESVKTELRQSTKKHFQAFLNEWENMN